ncbi:MAG: hypothetical protein REI64_07925 [Pedobacter sp.]|uniref:hypothetical protein n=1 Tax=Pedobacter sp. TaxID=1411316 RepID=UPI002806985D|nr:hypothetical protein [Pedobacter sp.]MDQ8004711.1 hypothetical protein [Pedobacter sp.]
MKILFADGKPHRFDENRAEETYEVFSEGIKKIEQTAGLSAPKKYCLSFSKNLKNQYFKIYLKIISKLM